MKGLRSSHSYRSTIPITLELAQLPKACETINISQYSMGASFLFSKWMGDGSVVGKGSAPVTKLAGAPPAVTCAAFVYDAGLAQRAYVFARTWLHNHFCWLIYGASTGTVAIGRAIMIAVSERIQIAYLSTLAGATCGSPSGNQPSLNDRV